MHQVECIETLGVIIFRSRIEVVENENGSSDHNAKEYDKLPSSLNHEYEVHTRTCNQEHGVDVEQRVDFHLERE